MSRAGWAALAVVAALAAPAHAEAPRHALWVALPSLDGVAGAEVGGERGLAPRHGAVLALGVRQSATGDYGAVRLAVAGAYRWYWRGRSLGNAVAGLERTGWFVGGRVDLGTAGLSMGDRAVGRTAVVGARAELGYRLTPWRGLMITGVLGLGAYGERDAAGRLPLQTHAALGGGLDLGWTF